MPSLLNTSRPPVFCPGCSHEFVVKALDKAFQDQGLSGTQIALVSDIGCSGLFDTFFHTHALHGLHGRALTYATGLKMARPDLHVVVTMGDGGLGIGGAHLLAACRRNLDLTLLILNNFNFGMTGGQFSSTTPPESSVGSGFLNQVERPMDACQVLEAAGAPYLVRTSAYAKDLAQTIAAGMKYRGFSALDIWGGCPGRYMKRNKISPKIIEDGLASLPAKDGVIPSNERKEYTQAIQEITAGKPEPSLPPAVTPTCSPPQDIEQGVLILGAAGQRVVTAGELLGLAGMCAGLQASQKNDYPITVLTGHSVSEVILSPEAIDYTGLSEPSVVIVLAEEGINRRKDVFDTLPQSSVVLRAVPDLGLSPTRAEVVDLDLKTKGIKKADYALASLAALAQMEKVLNRDMLETAIGFRFPAKIAEASRKVVAAVV
ncbi:MAG: thiamine pyrophosphate-dependent enzyme [Desulfovermiculus sp.]|nr:thiamine pyrophosphate-dependent enzyme [Desulfovermiculus sp.]